ncbi:hypothetical protein Ate02nite_38780 [Paractinoplanes tereljensis]|uniref:Uncharacterized protein n=1 Tax=Paractinoplanes tereljensis TaxID=571912 RepID=A0A919NMZ6_9ACTN|nr:hypothetical protein Ate02nite_38780 [Actinoplanes tereljensis]
MPGEPVRSKTQMPADRVIAVLPNPDTREITTNRTAFRRTARPPENEPTGFILKT